MPKIKTIPLLEIIFKSNGGSSDVWKAVSELLYNKEDEISVFCPYIKNKINSYDKDTSILALTLLDFCVDDGKMPLWSALNTKNFLGSIVNNLKTKEEVEIQNMILYLIQKWGKKFSKNQELANFTSVYNYMKNNNISFPTETNHKYTKYVQLNKNTKINYNNSSSTNKQNEIFNSNKDRKTNQIMVETDPEDYLKDINVNLHTSNYDKIYKRLVNKLYDWTHAIHEANVLINQNNNGNNNSKIEGLCKDLAKGNKQLIETIQSGKLKDNTLMEISLNVTDDINMTLARWNNYKNGKPPGPFVSSFFQNDEWRNKKLNNNNTNNNFTNLNNFYNVNNSTININNQNSFNNNYNNNLNNNQNQFNNKNNNNFGINQELQNYPKLYEKIKNLNNNNYKNNINNFQNNNYPNINLNNNNFQNNNNYDNNPKAESNNQGSFNLLIDFDTAPLPPTSNKSNELNLNLNDKNNMDKFVDFLTMTEKLNKINNQKNIEYNNISNNRNNINNSNFNNNSIQNKNSNNDYFNNDVDKDIDNPYNERKFSNDVNTSKINKSVMYPSFEELEASNVNNNNNLNLNKNQKEEEDILSKFDF